MPLSPHLTTTVDASVSGKDIASARGSDLEYLPGLFDLKTFLELAYLQI
jgi:hypothetical protein